MRSGFTNHRKFRRLAQMLGDEVLALGHCEFLWQKAYEIGAPFLGDAVDVELAAHWHGEPGKLLRALLECGGAGRSGLVDEVENGYAVHDLWDHAPDFVRRRRDREMKREAKGSRLSSRPVSDRSVTNRRPVSDRSMVKTQLGIEEPNSLGTSFYSPGESQDPASSADELSLGELGAVAPPKPEAKPATGRARIFAVFDEHGIDRPAENKVGCWIRDVGIDGTLAVLAELGREGIGKGENYVTGAVRNRLDGFRGKNTLAMGPKLSQREAAELDDRVMDRARAARGAS